jgi:hypothetical protein
MSPVALRKKQQPISHQLLIRKMNGYEALKTEIEALRLEIVATQGKDQKVQ